MHGAVVISGSFGALSAGERNATLSRQAYVAVRRAIREGFLAPGRFYSESQLAKLLEISRTPVREAVIELAREGVVEKVPQRGFRLHIPTVSEIREAYELRALIEAYVVDRFTREASTEAIAALMALVDAQAAAVDIPDAHPEIDEEFHFFLPSAIGLDRSHRALLALRPPVWLPGTAHRDGTRLQQALSEHRRIVDRIAERDAAGAVQAIKEHIGSSALAARQRWASLAT